MKNVIYDRTFDAACMKRAGEEEWASQIITRLKNSNPELSAQIDGLYNGYLSLPDAEYIQYRTKFMLDHKETIKLKYK